MNRPFSAYEGDEPYAFVCYAHDDAAAFVYPEITWLRNHGTNIWYDEGISPGEEFPERLANAILRASIVVFYVSESSVNSRHCRNEVYLAMDRGVPVLAVHLEETGIPAGLALTTGTSQAIMRHKLPEQEYQEKLLAAIATLSSERRSIEVRVPSPTREWRRVLRKLAVVVAVPFLFFVGFISFQYFDHAADVRRAKIEMLPRIREMLDTRWSDYTEPYALAKKAEAIIPDDPALAALFDVISLKINIDSVPAGANVYMRHYREPEGEWRLVGTTPIRDRRVPVGIFRWKFEKEGYETVIAADASWALSPSGMTSNLITRTLDRREDIPEGMVRVQSGPSLFGPVPDFFIDRNEVTNAEFQQFVNHGGYQTRSFWRHDFVEEGNPLTWEEGIARFVDRTGRPGPSTWLGGSYPQGTGDHPVEGVSWYEADAYAAFLGRELPTGTHWGLARGDNSQFIMWPQLGGLGLLAPLSNFGSEGTVAVASLGGITAFGAYDMAGNVREWCSNDTSRGKLIRGGAWLDNTYQFTELGQAPPMRRGPGYGFRTAFYPEGAREPAAAFLNVPIKPSQSFTKEQVVSDESFEIFKEQFSYDDLPLNVERHVEKENAEWILERVTIDTPYGGGRMAISLFLPKNSVPPYQTVLYLPGSGSFFQSSSENMDAYMEFPVFLSFLVKSGRAVAYPVYQGTFERGDTRFMTSFEGGQPNFYSEWTVDVIKDLRRSIDYLETRNDIDHDKIAYYGMSWGALLSPIAMSVENRLKIGMIIAAGLDARGRESTATHHYLPRVKSPLLMMVGRYDSLIGHEASVSPFFELLGTKQTDKSMLVYDSDHIPPKVEYVAETLGWLDRYFGPVSRGR